MTHLADAAGIAEALRLEQLLRFDAAAAAEVRGRLPLPSVNPGGVCSEASHRFPSAALAGVDEAGRGALAGPLVVGCVCFGRPLPAGSDDAIASCWRTPLAAVVGIDDSKRLTARRREALFDRISRSAAWAAGWASAREVDAMGVDGAASAAASRALIRLPVWPLLLLCDYGLGPQAEALRAAGAPDMQQRTYVRGDQRSLHIAAASIVAKVVRDRWMEALGRRLPGYGLDRHKGYGTVTHRSALHRLGPSPAHRRSFRGVGVSCAP